MHFVEVSKEEQVATVVLSRGKVNALNEALVEELKTCFEELADDEDVRAVILTGRGKFFSFGLDIPELLPYSKEAFSEFMARFTDLYTQIFLFPKPVVAALNGHAIAGGCMLATAGDCRIMAEGRAKIALNEILIGSTVLTGAVEILKACVGHRNAETILYSGFMYTAEEALALGLIHHKTSAENLYPEARRIALEFAETDPAAFRGVKLLLRKPLADQFIPREAQSISQFVDIWYSESTRKKLSEVKIQN